MWAIFSWTATGSKICKVCGQPGNKRVWGAEDRSKSKSPLPKRWAVKACTQHTGDGGRCLRVEEVGNRGLILGGGVLPNDVSELLPSGCAFSEGLRALGWPDPNGQWEALDPGGGEEGTGMGWLSSLKGPSLRTTGSKKGGGVLGRMQSTFQQASRAIRARECSIPNCGGGCVL